MVSMTTPSISIVISSGICKSPRLTMSVVASVGGCEERRSSRTAPVKSNESAAAPVRASVTFSVRILRWSSRPKMPSESPSQDRHEVADNGVARA